MESPFSNRGCSESTNSYYWYRASHNVLLDNMEMVNNVCIRQLQSAIRMQILVRLAFATAYFGEASQPMTGWWWVRRVYGMMEIKQTESVFIKGSAHGILISAAARRCSSYPKRWCAGQVCPRMIDNCWTIDSFVPFAIHKSVFGVGQLKVAWRGVAWNGTDCIGHT